MEYSYQKFHLVGAEGFYSDDFFTSESDNLGLDSASVLCNNPSAMVPSLTLPPPSFDPSYFTEQSCTLYDDSGGGSNGEGTSQMNSNLSLPLSYLPEQTHLPNMEPYSLFVMSPRPMPLLVDEKMLRALSVLKESYGGGILAQVWVPISRGDGCFLTTSEQPYLLDQMLAGFREVSRSYTFSAEMKPGVPLGLPGRVFLSKVPEWTSNVIYYKDEEYLRVKHAITHHVRSSIALPIIDPAQNSCCAVLELVSTKEKPDFNADLENVCLALLAVNLKTATPPRLLRQSLSENQTAALDEIKDVLRVVCHAHRLPLALTWIPCSENVDECEMMRRRDGCSSSSRRCVLYIEKSACYVNDKRVEGFVHACMDHRIEEGQGIAGRALLSNHPYFFSDVKNYDISEYPLVHHARKYGLQAAVAIKLRSTYTGSDDYILEFFLPVNIGASVEQQHLLNNLSGTMHRICKSLRTVSDAESPASYDHVATSQILPGESLNQTKDNILEEMNSEAFSQQIAGRTRKQPERKRNAAEKTVSLSCLRQYFSGSLKDAAKSIGVCPTTLKRICRQHGISRWPSRKINKVNRSLKKIQNVLDSVEGVEGGLKFDPCTGGFVPAASFAPSMGIVEPNMAATYPGNFGEMGDFFVKTEEDERPPLKDGGATSCHPNNVSFEGWTCMGNSSDPENVEEGNNMRLDSQYTSQTQISSAFAADQIEREGIVDHDPQSCSSTTDSSMVHGSSSGSQSVGRGPVSAKTEHITVKITYLEDMVRFKFNPSLGCLPLYEEVAKRFKLKNGDFQLKYMDDEEEWVMLESDADLQECLEITEVMGKRSVKFLVRG